MPYKPGQMMPTLPNFADKTVWTGDNLDILRGMNSESVDLIYLDPPFNSSRNYAAPIAAYSTTATLPPARTFRGERISRPRSRTDRTSTSCSGSRRGTATAAGATSRSSCSRLTTWSRAHAAGLTTSTTCSFFVATATG